MSFYVLICHLYIIASEMSALAFLLIFDCFFIVESESSLYILDTIPLSDI